MPPKRWTGPKPVAADDDPATRHTRWRRSQLSALPRFSLATQARGRPVVRVRDARRCALSRSGADPTWPLASTAVALEAEPRRQWAEAWGWRVNHWIAGMHRRRS